MPQEPRHPTFYDQEASVRGNLFRKMTHLMGGIAIVASSGLLDANQGIIHTSPMGALLGVSLITLGRAIKN